VNNRRSTSIEVGARLFALAYGFVDRDTSPKKVAQRVDTNAFPKGDLADCRFHAHVLDELANTLAASTRLGLSGAQRPKADVFLGPTRTSAPNDDSACFVCADDGNNIERSKALAESRMAPTTRKGMKLTPRRTGSCRARSLVPIL
jgi:hypothetical protein